MEFLVQFQLDIPDGVPESVVNDRKMAEDAAAKSLADHGILLRLWNTPTGSGPTRVLGIYQAGSEVELESFLVALPLYEWMRTSITALAQHPNDPPRIRATA